MDETLEAVGDVVEPRLVATAADVARAVVFLCGPAASFVTNSDVVVPGNLYSRLSRHPA